LLWQFNDHGQENLYFGVGNNKKMCAFVYFRYVYEICKVSESTVSVGANVMLLNGLPVDVTSLELYELMDRISAEVIFIHECLLLQSTTPLPSTKHMVWSL